MFRVEEIYINNYCIYCISGEDIVKVLKTAAVDPAIYRQYILYFFIGRFLSYYFNYYKKKGL